MITSTLPPRNSNSTTNHRMSTIYCTNHCWRIGCPTIFRTKKQRIALGINTLFQTNINSSGYFRPIQSTPFTSLLDCPVSCIKRGFLCPGILIIPLQGYINFSRKKRGKPPQENDKRKISKSLFHGTTSMCYFNKDEHTSI